MLKIDKLFYMLLIVLLLLIIIPSSFAHENDTAITIDDESPIAVESVDDGELLKASSKDYYFDASVDKDGDGSIEYPYKYLTADRIKANANVYLANGEYKLDTAKTIEQVNFYGSGANSTIIKYDGVAFKVWNSLTLSNLTISDATIMNFEKLNATNVIFTHGNGCDPDSYGNNYGGAIYCPYYSSEHTPNVHIKNCTFTDNYAEYAGAIYMDGGNLDISDTIFLNNFAYNFGGAIAGEYGTSIVISKSKFYNSYSMADAGGAIYLRDSSLKMNNVEIVNSSATFGGAIATLNTPVTLNYLTVKDSSAKWDGGAIYHMYGEFSSAYGNFNNNSASNGGALFIDNSTSLFLRGNTFSNNIANYTAGALYSICNTFKGMSTSKQFNRFSGNKALFKNDEYELSTINLTIGSGNYTMYMNNASEVTSLPSYYSLRDHNLLTIPKDQQSSGNCWAFTAMAVLESAILKATGESLDLSEENMKNVIAQFSDYGWTIETNEGGYGPMPIGYLVSWLGPVNEIDDPFDDKGTLSPIFDSLMHVQNVVYLNRENFLDNDEIKKAIMQYGAVGTSMYYDSNFIRWEGYYCWVTYPSNHAVTIVGWDDNYSRDHFYGLPSTCGDGAWLVRNSWGPNWNDEGYFYVSYYDEKFAQPGVDFLNYAIILNDTIRYDKNYQYDIPGKSDFYYNDANEIWYKNLFQSEGSELLAGVSTYFEKVTDWVLSVVVNGDVKLTKEGTSNSGYYTIDLGKFIHLNAGDILEVIFKVNGSDKTSFPISEKVSFNKVLYKPGISYFSLDGVNWVDLYNFTDSYGTHTYSSQVACIKAFTITNPVNTTSDLLIDYDGDRPVNITVTVVDQYGHPLEDGNVTFNINGNEYVINVTDGMAKIAPAFVSGLNSISATFNGEVYNPSSVIDEITIDGQVTELDLSISKFQRNVNITVSVLDSVYGNVTITVNNESYSSKVKDKKAIFNLNLENGVYYVTAYLNDSVFESDSITQMFTIDVRDTGIESPDMIVTEEKTLLVVNLTDDLGNQLSEKTIIFNLNGQEYSNVTDNDGKTSFEIDLPIGNYNAIIYYDGDDNYMGSSKNITIKVNRITPNIQVTTNDIVYGDVLVVDVELPSDVTRRAVVEIDGISKFVTLKDGKGSVKFSGVSVGNQTVIVSYNGDVNYGKASVSSSIVVSPAVADIKISAKSIVWGNNLTVGVVLPDDVVGGVNVSVGDETKFVSLTDGVGSVEFSGLAVGTYEVSVVFLGDDNYLESSASINAKVDRANPEIKVTANDIVYGDVLVVDVELPSDITRRAVVSVDGESKYITLKNGKGQLKFNGLRIGNHSIVVSYNGDVNYAKASVSSSIVVSPGAVAIGVSASPVTYGDNVTVGVVLPSDVVGGVNVSVGDETKFVSLTDGVGSVEFSGLAVGTYEVSVVFLGDDNYLESSASINVKVDRATPEIQVTANDISYGEALVVDVQLPSDVTRRAIITIDGKSKFISLKEGKGSIKLTGLEVGTHEIQVSYAGDSNYKSSSMTAVVEINN